MAAQAWKESDIIRLIAVDSHKKSWSRPSSLSWGISGNLWESGQKESLPLSSSHAKGDIVIALKAPRVGPKTNPTNHVYWNVPNGQTSDLKLCLSQALRTMFEQSRISDVTAQHSVFHRSPWSPRHVFWGSVWGARQTTKCDSLAVDPKYSWAKLDQESVAWNLWSQERQGYHTEGHHLGSAIPWQSISTEGTMRKHHADQLLTASMGRKILQNIHDPTHCKQIQLLTAEYLCPLNCQNVLESDYSK